MLQFCVYSNKSNPVPYKRTTQKQKYVDKDYQRYIAWKDKVFNRFLIEFEKFPHQVFKKKRKYYVNIHVYYKDKKHGDTDNVAKGINDAIFQKPLEDKYVAGSYDYSYDPQNPRVEVLIQEAN